MSLIVNDDRKDDYLPSSVTVYANVKPRAPQIDCRTCQRGGMSSCYIGGCAGGADYVASAPVQFWEKP